MLRRADRVIGLIIVAGGIALAILISGIEINAQQSTLSARFFPTLLVAVLIGFGILLVLRPGLQSTSKVLTDITQRRGILIAVLFLTYCLTFRYVDFRFGAWAFTLLAQWVLGSRKPLELILVPILVSGSVFLIFRYGFTILLPTWS